MVQVVSKYYKLYCYIIVIMQINTQNWGVKITTLVSKLLVQFVTPFVAVWVECIFTSFFRHATGRMNEGTVKLIEICVSQSQGARY